MANCLTIKSNQGLLNALTSLVGFAVPYDPKYPPVPVPPVHQFNGLWDTGATGTVITQNVIDRLGIHATAMTKVHHAHGEAIAEVFYVNVFLPNNVGFAAVKVTKGNLANGIDALIGMDIIGTGDFAVTNFVGRTAFTFRHPSSACIDFVDDYNRSLQTGQNRQQRRAMRHKK